MVEMEFDLDYEPVSWNSELEPISERGIEIIKVILESDLEEFSERQIADLLGVKRVRLERLWKAGLLRKYGAIKPSTQPRRIWAPDYQAILYALSGDPEICSCLQKRARRQQSVVQTDRFQRGGIVSDCRVSHLPSPRRRIC